MNHSRDASPAPAAAHAPGVGLRSASLHVAFAFTVMGAWAAYANHAHGMSAALRAGLLQGAVSAAMTLLIKRAVDVLHRRTHGRWALAPIGVCLGTATLLVALHLLAGTPNVAGTVALPWSLSTLYAFGYAASLRNLPS